MSLARSSPCGATRATYSTARPVGTRIRRQLESSCSGRAQAGAVFAWSSLTTKLALALAGGIAFPALEMLGFSASGENDASALFALAALYCLAPIPFKLAAIALIWRFPIDRRRQQELRETLRRQEVAA